LNFSGIDRPCPQSLSPARQFLKEKEDSDRATGASR
jgi:hypothetical protein